MSMALDHGGRMIGFEGRGMEKWDVRGWGVQWAVIFSPTFLPPFFRWKGPKQARGTPALDVMMTQAHSCLFASWTCCISLLFTFACLTLSCAYQSKDAHISSCTWSRSHFARLLNLNYAFSNPLSVCLEMDLRSWYIGVSLWLQALLYSWGWFLVKTKFKFK